MAKVADKTADGATEKNMLAFRIDGDQRQKIEKRARNLGYRDTSKAMRTLVWAVNTLSEEELRELLKRGVEAQHKAGVV